MFKTNKIIIDPGHGGYDWGLRTGKRYNKGYDNCLEKDINLEVANRFAWLCSEHKIPYILTRYGDRYIGLRERCFRANSMGGILFISIHCNYALNSKISGLETYSCRGSYSGKAWAAKFQFVINDLKFTKDRGIKTAGFYVLKHTKMPAILLELGYLSNPSDCKYLNNENNQGLIASRLLEAVRTIANGR